MITRVWPEPYLQPLGSRDCSYYAVAYIARVLGDLGMDAESVMDWRAQTRKHESHFIGQALGGEFRHWGEDAADDDARRRWWLGPTARPWVEGWLADGWIGLALVHRIPELAHAVVVLDATEAGAVLMDPWPTYGGFLTESWDWFLGVGAGTHGCHRIDGWYRKGSVRC